MATLDEGPIITLGTKPIPGADPCGTEAADDEDYILVQAEIAKLDRIEAGEPEWHTIERAAVSVLQAKAKDIEIASTLGLALFKRCRYAGLAAWVSLIQELVNHFWDGLFPAKPRRRKLLIEIVTDRFTDGGWFRDNPPKADDFDALERCAARMGELEAALSAKMPDDPPDFKKFLRALKEQLAKRVASTAAAPAPGAASGPGGAGLAAGEVTDRGSAISAVLGAAGFLRKADAADPLPYALVRAVKWSKIELPSSDAGKYQIDPPEASLLDTLQHQSGAGLWENLLKNAEAAFRTTDPLWLDLQRYVCTAMQALGAPYDHARQVVSLAAAGLVRRLGDGLYELKFKNGTPLCSGQTRMWIEAEAGPAQGAGGAAASESNGRLNELTGLARKLVASGKLKEALAALHEGLSGCTQRRDRLVWRLRIGQLCFEAQRLQLAGPLLEECFQEIQRFGISEWEPALAVDVAQTLYRCRKSVAQAEKTPSPGSLEKVRESFAWLCQLDPAVALAVEPSGN